MLELYNSPVSTCSQKVRMTLWEKELPWQERLIIFSTNEHLSDWYLAINPNGVVPTLVHDGKTIIDSAVINEYLDDVFPDLAGRLASAASVRSSGLCSAGCSVYGNCRAGGDFLAGRVPARLAAASDRAAEHGLARRSRPERKAIEIYNVISIAYVFAV